MVFRIKKPKCLPFIAGMGERFGMVRFFLNNDTVCFEGDESMSLLKYLREERGLVSVKDGCSQGACGACLVEVDAKPLLACATPLKKLEGRRVFRGFKSRRLKSPIPGVLSAPKERAKSAWCPRRPRSPMLFINTTMSGVMLYR
ncbi:MAG: hypothetical protein EHM45_05205 [Desulfobacteraceae bacterium]|nr:MAG: hypothetical protein EHM45_05205 [Desulfobacteraceae bacterium]